MISLFEQVEVALVSWSRITLPQTPTEVFGSKITTFDGGTCLRVKIEEDHRTASFCLLGLVAGRDGEIEDHQVG